MLKLKKSALCMLAILLCSSIVSGCNTTRGFGQDVQAGGRAITSAAR